jgi:hypothetical protein
VGWLLDNARAGESAALVAAAGLGLQVFQLLTASRDAAVSEKETLACPSPAS